MIQLTLKPKVNLLLISCTQFGVPRAAETLDGAECTKEPIETIIEWKSYRLFLAQHPKETISTQLQELATNDMMGAIYPNLKALATICLTMPVTTASVERSLVANEIN